MKKLFSILSLFLFCYSCATPTVINVIGPNDNKLNCEELSAEIKKNVILSGEKIFKVLIINKESYAY